MIQPLPIILVILLKFTISRNVFNNIPLCEPENVNGDDLSRTVFDVVVPRSIAVYPCIGSDGAVKYDECDEENIVSDVVELRTSLCGSGRRDIEYTDVKNVRKILGNSKNKRFYHRLKFMGNLKSSLPIPRQASGKVYVRKSNPSVIIISKFRYSGIGNDTFFWAGKGDSPSEQTIPGFPLGDGYNGKGLSYPYYSTSIPLLGTYMMRLKYDLVLHLPPGVTVRDLDWISVWDRQTQCDFGSARIRI